MMITPFVRWIIVFKFFYWSTQPHIKNFYHLFIRPHFSPLNFLSRWNAGRGGGWSSEIVWIWQCSGGPFFKFLILLFCVCINKCSKQCATVTVTTFYPIQIIVRTLVRLLIFCLLHNLLILCYSYFPFSSNRTIRTVHCMVKSNSNTNCYLHWKIKHNLYVNYSASLISIKDQFRSLFDVYRIFYLDALAYFWFITILIIINCNINQSDALGIRRNMFTDSSVYVGYVKI